MLISSRKLQQTLLPCPVFTADKFTAEFPWGGCFQIGMCKNRNGRSETWRNLLPSPLLCGYLGWPQPTAREGNGTPLQHSCLENPMDRGAWEAAVHEVTRIQTRLSDFTFTFHFYALEWLHFHFSLLCTGEGNGNPLRCSCLENSRDGGAWWAVIYGVAQSWTRLKRLSNSSILYWCFSFWLTSLCIIGSTFIHLIRTDSNAFFLIAE